MSERAWSERWNTEVMRNRVTADATTRLLALQRSAGNGAVTQMLAVQRRPITTQESNAFQHMEDVAAEAAPETRMVAATYDGADFAKRLRLVKAGLIAEVGAVAPGTQDPDQLMAQLWTLHVWTTAPGNYAQARAIHSSLPVRDAAAGDYKCNRFVGDTYAVGARRGYAPDGAGRAYPTGRSGWWDPRDPYPPSANELGSGRGATGNLTNLPETTAPRGGDIIAFPHPGGGFGHTGIVLGEGIYVSARHSPERPAKRIQVDDGVQVTNVPQLTSRYRRLT